MIGCLICALIVWKMNNMQIPKEYIENLIKDAKEIINSADEDGNELHKIPPLLARIIDLESLIK